MARIAHSMIDIEMPWNGKEKVFRNVCVECCQHKMNLKDSGMLFPQPFIGYYTEEERKVLVHLLYKKAIQEWRRRGEEVDLG